MRVLRVVEILVAPVDEVVSAGLVRLSRTSAFLCVAGESGIVGNGVWNVTG